MFDPDTFADNWAKAQEDAYQRELEKSDKFNEWCDEQADALTEAIYTGDIESTFPTSWGYNTAIEILAEYIAQKFDTKDMAKLAVAIHLGELWLPAFEAWYRDMIFEYGEMD